MIKYVNSLILLGILAVGVIYVFPRVFPALSEKMTQPLPVDCYVGMTGQNVSVTVSGLGAGFVCDRIVESDKRLYRLTQPPTQPIMCERTVRNYHFIVRDQGVLKVLGNQFCSSIENWAR